MKIGELAQKIQVSRVHAWRLAKAGVVPGTKKTKGGHFYFVRCRALTRWINFMIGGAFRKKELARAYAKNYGSENFKDRRERRRTFKEYRMAERRNNFHEKEIRRENSEEYFNSFHYGVTRVEAIVKDMHTFFTDEKVPWMKDVNKAMRARLTSLRDQLNKYLKD